MTEFSLSHNMPLHARVTARRAVAKANQEDCLKIDFRLSPKMMKMLRNFDWNRFRDQFPKGHQYGHSAEGTAK